MATYILREAVQRIGLTEMADLKRKWRLFWGGDLNSSRLEGKPKSEPVPDFLFFFPVAKVDIKERRGVILELRAYLDEATFVEVYANAMTGKRSFALISKGERITGYDNYRFWHYHPPDNPDDHIPCAEPVIDLIFSSFKDVFSKAQQRLGK